VAAMGLYNQCVTGNPFLLPYVANERTYSAGGTFLFQSAPPPKQYRHPMMRYFHQGWEHNRFEEAKSWTSIPTWHFVRARKLWEFYLGPLLSISVLGAWWVLRDRRVRPAVVVVVATLLALAPEVWTHPHYAAPATAAVYVLILQAFRHFRWARGYPNFSVIPIAVFVICFALAAFRAVTPPPGPYDHEFDTWCCTPRIAIPYRNEVTSILNNLPGKQVVIVRYGPNHIVHQEWVYNRADIEEAQVVWAREMDAAHNAELSEYFRGRHAWLLDTGSTPPRLLPFPQNDSGGH
jgi:hypothetical protein